MTEFSFEVPQCEPGSTLKVTAIDGVVLKIPIPSNVRPGDELFMSKDQEGNWSIAKVQRTVVKEQPAQTPLFAPPQAATPWRSAEEMAADCCSGEAVTVELETTKGPIQIKIVPSWAPIGAARFLDLVNDGYFRDIAIYRGIQHGLLQFGVVKGTDPRASQYDKLLDDKLIGIPYAEGVISFAAAGPCTRKSTVCIMKADFRTQLGKGTVGTPSTETPIGMVAPESMAVMHSINCLGDIPQCGGCGPDPGKLEALGNEYIFREFPTCDFVRSARRV